MVQVRTEPLAPLTTGSTTAGAATLMPVKVVVFGT